MLKIIKELLLKIVDNIDSGNSNIDDEESIKLINILKEYTDSTKRLSKYQACKYLNISRATFDNLVRCNKLPKGIKEQGFKELFWIKKDLIKYNDNKKKF